MLVIKESHISTILINKTCPFDLYWAVEVIEAQEYLDWHIDDEGTIQVLGARHGVICWHVFGDIDYAVSIYEECTREER